MNRSTEQRYREAKSFRQRRCILVSSLLLFIVSTLLIACSIRYAKAEEPSEILNISDTDMQEIVELEQEQNKSLLNLTKLFTTRGPAEEDGPSLLYSLMVGVEGGEGEVYALGRVGREICSVIGAVLVLTYAAIQFLQMAQRENESTEIIMRIMTTAVIGMLMVIYIYDITTAIENLGGAFYSSVTSELNKIMTANGGKYIPQGAGTSVSAEGFDATNKVANAVSSGISSLGGSINSGLATFIASFTMYATFYMIVTAGYGLVFELVIRKIFAPIAVADFVSEGMRSPGAKYLKNYFGIYLRMVMFAAIVALGWAACSWAEHYTNLAFQINTRRGAIGVVYCVRFAMKGLISASGQTTREILGG